MEIWFIMEPIKDTDTLRNGTIISSMVPGLGTTLKYFSKIGRGINFKAVNLAY